MRLVVLCVIVALAPCVAHAQRYLGNLSANPYDPESTSNPFGRYGSPYSSDSINNRFGAGSPYSIDSPTNPYGRGLVIMGDE